MIRPIGTSLMVNTVVITPVVLVKGLRGADEETYPGPSTTVAGCSVQGRGETAIKSRRAAGGGAELAKITHCIRFNGDPGVKVNDRITWGTKTLKALGPARSEGGQDVAFSVDCEETA